MVIIQKAVRGALRLKSFDNWQYLPPPGNATLRLSSHIGENEKLRMSVGNWNIRGAAQDKELSVKFFNNKQLLME